MNKITIILTRKDELKLSEVISSARSPIGISQAARAMMLWGMHNYRKLLHELPNDLTPAQAMTDLATALDKEFSHEDVVKRGLMARTIDPPPQK